MRGYYKNLIKEILSNDSKARDDDMYLIARVIECLSIDDSRKYEAIHMLDNWKNSDLPNFNTIIRARRKIQVDNPELINIDTAKGRKRAEEEFRKEYGKKD